MPWRAKIAAGIEPPIHEPMMATSYFLITSILLAFHFKACARSFAQINDDLFSAKTINNIVSTDTNLHHICGDEDAVLTARKGLLIHMRMREQASELVTLVDEEFASFWKKNVPAVGVVIPTRVRVGYRYVESPASVGSLDGADVGHVGIGRR